MCHMKCKASNPAQYKQECSFRQYFGGLRLLDVEAKSNRWTVGNSVGVAVKVVRDMWIGLMFCDP
jgi:hypothetical protein